MPKRPGLTFLALVTCLAVPARSAEMLTLLEIDLAAASTELRAAIIEGVRDGARDAGLDLSLPPPAQAEGLRKLGRCRASVEGCLRVARKVLRVPQILGVSLARSRRNRLAIWRLEKRIEGPVHTPIRTPEMTRKRVRAAVARLLGVKLQPKAEPRPLAPPADGGLPPLPAP